MNLMKFNVLDALRGVAAIFVVVRHSGEFFGGNPFYSSFMAVDMFFLLSGFVIAHAYDRKIIQGEIGKSHFILIRVIRFYPSYFLSVALAAWVCFLNQRGVGYSTAGNIFLTLVFIPNFLQGISGSLLFPINSVYWSLFYELVVNIFYVLTRKLDIDKIICCMTFFCGSLITYFAVKDGSIDNGFSWGKGSIALGFSRSFFGIFLGIYLYRVREVRLFRGLESFSTIGPLMLVIFILAAPKLEFLGCWFQLLSVFLLFPLSVVWASKARGGNFSPLLVTLGLISYPAYVLHVPVTKLLNYFLSVEIRTMAPISGFLFLFIFIGLCVLVERYYERPLLRYMKNFAGKLSASANSTFPAVRRQG